MDLYRLVISEVAELHTGTLQCLRESAALMERAQSLLQIPSLHPVSPAFPSTKAYESALNSFSVTSDQVLKE